MRIHAVFDVKKGCWPLGWRLFMATLLTVIFVTGSNASEKNKMIKNSSTGEPSELSAEDLKNARSLYEVYGVRRTTDFSMVQQQSTGEVGGETDLPGNLLFLIPGAPAAVFDDVDYSQLLADRETQLDENNLQSDVAIPRLPFGRRLVKNRRGVPRRQSNSEITLAQEVGEDFRDPELQYPYSTIGYLIYRIPNEEGKFRCTAAVLRPRLILTTAFCVHPGDGDENSWHTDFEFIPTLSFDPNTDTEPREPFGKWVWETAWVTKNWFLTGDDLIAHPEDWAIIELRDQNIGGQTTSIWELTGFLGAAFHTQTFDPCAKKPVTMVGYPFRTDAQGDVNFEPQEINSSTLPDDNNNCVAGNDWFEPGGALGSPWIHEFGWISLDVGGKNQVVPNGNFTISAISYWRADRTLELVGGSRFNKAAYDLIKDACFERDGNCLTRDFQ